MEHKQWFAIGDLNIERSKPTACVFKDEIYIFGGLSNNENVLNFPAEKFNYESQKWETMKYNGYDSPFLTNSTASTSLIPFQSTNNLLLLGGSNLLIPSNLVQKMVIKEK